MKLTIALKGNGDVEIQAEAEVDPIGAPAVARAVLAARDALAGKAGTDTTPAESSATP